MMIKSQQYAFLLAGRIVDFFNKKKGEEIAMEIYLVEKVAFIDGYWGYAFAPVKAFTTKEKAEEFLSSLGEEGRIVKIELEGDLEDGDSK